MCVGARFANYLQTNCKLIANHPSRKICAPPKRTISKDAPPWFRTSKALGTYFRPLPPGDRTTYFTTTSEDHLNADGSRKVVSLGPGGVEDTAVVSFLCLESARRFSSYSFLRKTTQSEDTPSWFHANGVTKVPKCEP